MRYGVCAPPEALMKAVQGRAAYIECPVTGLRALSDAQIQGFADTVKDSGIRCEALNVLFPGDIPLLAPGADRDAIRDYVSDTFRRVSVLKPDIIVFGSGKARTRPAEMTPEAAFERLAETGRLIASEAEPYDIVIALEPLNTTETNMVNSLAEGAALVRAAGHPHFRLLADFYHMFMEDEPANAIHACKGLLVHTHIAMRDGRSCPRTADRDTLAPYFAALRSIGYNSRMSVEGNMNDMESELPEAFDLFGGLERRQAYADT